MCALFVKHRNIFILKNVQQKFVVMKLFVMQVTPIIMIQ